MRIGIDVARTHADAVLMRDDVVLASAKHPFSGDIATTVAEAVAQLSARRAFRAQDIDAVMVGTMQFMNTLLKAEGLSRTAVVRLGLPATSLLPPFAGWPARMAAAVHGSSFLAHGGHEFDGRLIAPVDPQELRRVAGEIGRSGITAVTISSVFSPINADAELEAQQVLRDELGDAVVFSLSHEFGGIGLLERENAAIVNTALLKGAGRTFDELALSLARNGITAPLYVSQNDGTLMNLERARRYPVATFASGSTNSMRGAAFLSGISDCVVIDVGGVTWWLVGVSGRVVSS